MSLSLYMELCDEYIWIMIAIGVSFLLSLFVLFNAKRKWLGCILQFFTFIVLFIISGLLFGMCREWVDTSNESEAMVGVRLIEEDRNCRFEIKWWMKPDNTYYYEFDKGSNHHQVEPCGNDKYNEDIISISARFLNTCLAYVGCSPKLYSESVAYNR